MSEMFVIKVGFYFLCFFLMGCLVGLQYAHVVERASQKKKASVFRYIFTIALLFVIIWVLAKAGGFEKVHWLIDILPIMIIIGSTIFSARFFLKRNR